MSTWQPAPGMEAQNPPAAAADPGPGPSPRPSRGSSELQALPQPLYLKALTIPLFQPVQPGCFQPHGPLVTTRSCVHLNGSNIPLILSPLVPPEGAEQPQPLFQKQLGQSLTLSIVSTLPVLSSPSSCVSAPIGSPGKSKKSGKYICKHCGRDCLKPSVLEKHIRSHTGERPFPCTTCGIAFKTQSNLYKHRRTQTHVNNTRLPSDSDISGGPEQNERAAESTTSPQGSKVLSSTSEDQEIHIKQPSSETSAATDTKKPHELSLPATSSPSAASANQETMSQSLSSKAIQGVPEREPQSLPSPGLQRQQATSSEKQWDYKPLDCKLKKCESTDSGYLSRSDSTEQQMTSSSPLHSLYEHSTELENETAFSSPRCASGSSAKPEAGDKATASMLEKKRLEEHISKLISHNKSVVDDTQLDNVRPRKTVLSKQGSIDLPMPYRYKDSFHFDIRTCDVNRKKNLSLCSAKSTFAPLEKCKPMFFHSVPTQFSTTIDTVPVTRSNSLPVVEGARMVHDKPGCSKPLSLTKQSVNTGTAGLLPSNDLAANSVDFPNSHSRALVRQTAVDDLPLGNVADHPPLSEELKGTKKLEAGEVISGKNKKHNPRKLKMFSQEKWQMYGDETFKKIYQKMKSSQNAKKIKQRENKVTAITNLTPNSMESASSTEITEERDGRRSASDSPSSLVTGASTTGESGTSADGNHDLQNVSSEETADRVSNLMETSHSVTAGRGHCSGIQCLPTTLVKFSSKAEKQKSSTGINEDTGGTEDVEYRKTIKLPTQALNYSDINLLSHPVGISKASLVGFLGSELRGSDSNAFALHNATDGDDKTGAKVPIPNNNAVDVSSKSHHLQSDHLSPVPQQNAFSPKYILKLPQDKRASDLSPLHRPEEEMTPGTPQQDIGREDWKNKQNKNKLNCQRQTEEKWMTKSTCSTQTPKKKICFTSVYTSGFFISADIKDERKALHHLCSGSDSLIKTSVSSKGAEPTILGWDRAGSPRILRGSPPPLQDLQHCQSSRDNPTYFCHSFGTFYCHTLSTDCKGFPVLPHNNRTSFSGTSPVPGSKSTFPSLSAEPRLTWCCLSRSLPLPWEQSGNAASAHPSVHTWDKEPGRECTLSKYDISIFKMRNINKTVAYGLTNTSLKTLVSSFSKGHQMQEVILIILRANLSQHLLELHGSADKTRSHLQPNPYGRPHGTAPATLKKPPVTLRSSEIKSYSATPPKTYKKRGLEMMRKQTRVEYDDTSSDDEDRLVIEI
uniref:Zinc finger protein 831 n=1 Tax=Cyanoderma ruficeps TaxID=181631 RepID=A0A8C3QQB2_9PASS